MRASRSETLHQYVWDDEKLYEKSAAVDCRICGHYDQLPRCVELSSSPIRSHERTKMKGPWQEKPCTTVYRVVCSMYVFMYVCIVITYSKSKDQPGKVANPARGQLNREK